MKQEYSAEELEVARILVLLPRLVWEADHAPPCTHNLRWGTRRQRSAGADDDPQGAPPQPRHPPQPPPATLKPGKKRSREAAAALRKAARREPPESLGTSSPETPLDFCPSAEEPDAKAARPPAAASPPAKKPKQKREHLAKQVEQLNRTRTELQKEAAEIRNRLEALKRRNSELIELRFKFEKEGELQRQEGGEQRLLHQRSCLDLLQRGPARPIAAVHTAQQQQHYQHGWPQHWVGNQIVFHQVASGFPIHTTSPAAAGKQHWNWAASQAWRVDGDNKVPELNSGADVGLASETHQHPQQHHHHNQQQSEQRRSSPEEQRAARKKRIEMIQKRRNAASGASVKAASSIR